MKYILLLLFTVTGSSGLSQVLKTQDQKTAQTRLIAKTTDAIMFDRSKQSHNFGFQVTEYEYEDTSVDGRVVATENTAEYGYDMVGHAGKAKTFLAFNLLKFSKSTQNDEVKTKVFIVKNSKNLQKFESLMQAAEVQPNLKLEIDALTYDEEYAALYKWKGGQQQTVPYLYSVTLKVMKLESDGKDVYWRVSPLTIRFE